MAEENSGLGIKLVLTEYSPKFSSAKEAEEKIEALEEKLKGMPVSSDCNILLGRQTKVYKDGNSQLYLEYKFSANREVILPRVKYENIKIKIEGESEKLREIVEDVLYGRCEKYPKEKQVSFTQPFD